MNDKVAAEAAPAGPQAPTAPSALPEALEAWRLRLAAAGVACRALALHGPEARWQVDFPAAYGTLPARWAHVRGQVNAERPFVIDAARGAAEPELLLACTIQLPQGQRGIVGVALAPPHAERIVQLVLLALGWLQLAFSAELMASHQRAGRLLELLGHVAAEGDARAAAQEWVNRSAAWAREAAGDAVAGFSLTLFRVDDDVPRWWVAADTAWVESASPALQAATETATQAVVEMREVQPPRAWAMPALADGEVVAVLVARLDDGAGPALAPAATTVLRASLGLAEPLLRRWRDAERPLWRHAVDSTRAAARKLFGRGHPLWKAVALATVAALGLLFAVPVPDRVNANAVIEGRVRQVITAPFDGFIGQVRVRPGERVVQGQLLARLDERDLRLEQRRHASERDQAAAKVRVAMAERDASSLALALAEQQQAEAQLALVGAKLARTELVAPLAGLVVSGDWAQQIGGPVETGKQMFEIAAGEGWRVVLHVPDREIARVAEGQRGALRLAGQPQTAFAFTVRTLTATASVQDGVNGFRVEADWTGDAPPLSPGMQGVGKIEVGTTNLATAWTRSSIDWLRLRLWAWGW